MARNFWPTENPLGKRIRLSISASQRGPWAEIIGVVRDVPLRQLNEEAQPEAYLSTAQGPLIGGVTARGMTLTVRTAAYPLALADDLRREVWGVDSAVPISFVGTAEQALGQTVAQSRFNLILLGLFAVVALLLAAVGIYGILANAVRLRTHEIGIRLALGARPGSVFRLIAGQGMGLATIGVGLGNESRSVGRIEAGMKPTRFRFCLWLIRATGVIVPRRLRADWKQSGSRNFSIGRCCWTIGTSSTCVTNSTCFGAAWARSGMRYYYNLEEVRRTRCFKTCVTA
jgi:hypothetical protein